jgi:hypothetical protein
VFDRLVEACFGKLPKFDSYPDLGGFNESWSHSVKRTQIWEKMQRVGRKAQINDAKLGKKDEHRAQISSVGRKLLLEIFNRQLFLPDF